MQFCLQGFLPQLLLEMKTAFPLETVFTPPELEDGHQGAWPSMDALLAAGKRVLFVSGSSYGPLADAFMFNRHGPLSSFCYIRHL